MQRARTQADRLGGQATPRRRGVGKRLARIPRIRFTPGRLTLAIWRVLYSSERGRSNSSCRKGSLSMVHFQAGFQGASRSPGAIQGHWPGAEQSLIGDDSYSAWLPRFAEVPVLCGIISIAQICGFSTLGVKVTLIFPSVTSTGTVST